MKKKHSEEHENLERWLLTYADLITLLLAFFIMLYTLSKNDENKYQEIAMHLNAIFSGGTGQLAKGFSSGNSLMDFPANKQSDAEIKKKLNEEIGKMISETSKNGSKNGFSVTSDERGIVVRVLDKTFFDEGRAELKDKAKNVLDKLAPILSELNNNIRIEGHTDNVPINTYEFRSNWELSTRRATEVVRYLIEKHKIPPEKLSVSGYAEYKPVVSNNTPEERAMNRRIEVIILKSK